MAARDRAARRSFRMLGRAWPYRSRPRGAIVAAEENPEQFAAVKEEMDRTGKVDPAYQQVRKHGQRRGAASLKQRKKCHIKGLLKPIKTLVAEGQLSHNLAKRFAEKVDKEAQEQLIAGKDGAAIVAVVKAWRAEHDCLENVARLARMISPSLLRSHHEESWHVGKATPEGRKVILEHLNKAQAALNEVRAAVTKADEIIP